MSESKRLDIVLDAGSLNGSIPSLPFAVTFEGEAFKVLRLFDATVELEAKRDGYKCTLRKSSVLVDPDVIQWYPATKPTLPRQPQPELRVVPEGIEEKDKMSEATRTCRVCGKEKPKDQFPPTGKNAKRCLDCAGDAALQISKPTPIKRSVKTKAVKKTKVAPAWPATANGTAYDNVIKLLQKRDSLKAQLAEVQAQLQEIVASA